MKKDGTPKKRGGRAPRAGGARARQQLALAERAKQAWQLKASGATWEQIVKQLGYADKKHAWSAMQQYRLSIPAPAVKEWRDLENAKLDLRESKFLVPLLAEQDQKLETMVERDRRVAEIARDRRKLLGLDKPVAQKVEHSGGIDLELRLVREMTSEERREFIATKQLPARLLPLLSKGESEQEP